jgi:hypothetical protein
MYIPNILLCLVIFLLLLFFECWPKHPNTFGCVSLIREKVTAWSNPHTIDNTESGRQEQRKNPPNPAHDLFGLEVRRTNINSVM